MKRTFIVPFLLLALVMIIPGCDAEPLIFPGQSKPVSENMTKAIKDVERRLGSHINWGEVTGSSNPQAGNGLMIWNEGKVTIYLNSTRSYEIQEAIAAHELAHVVQILNGYYFVEPQSQLLEESLKSLANVLVSSINALALDLDADNWVIQRGFNEKELREFDVRERLNEISSRGLVIEDPNNLTTQINALRYARNRAVFEPDGLFTDLDKAYAKNLPVSRSLGTALFDLVKDTGLDTKEECNLAIVKIVNYLSLSVRFFRVIDGYGKVIWP